MDSRYISEQNRCIWANNPMLRTYHDTEWGVPLHDDRKHFEFLILDSFQAGLSWAIILNKRDGLRTAFHDFDADKVANMTKEEEKLLLLNPAIIRNKAKIRAAINNARAFMAIQREFGSFDAYIWRFTNYKTIKNAFLSHKEIPTHSPESDAMSKDLKKRGFSFVGSTICYAYMQAAGMINDHLTTCFRYDESLV
ncbi:DNA-3-methyladenine glycosylase I [Ignavibacteria bacterium]|nr:DNA-3-methyladenine glycosylase I [Bacteroidota bacterium]